jgi:hypothetical protein
LEGLPTGVDPGGERGKFHTFCCRCSEFQTEIPITVVEAVHRDGFWFAELRPGEWNLTVVSSIESPVHEALQKRSAMVRRFFHFAHEEEVIFQISGTA